MLSSTISLPTLLTDFQTGIVKADWAERGAYWCFRPLRMSCGCVEKEGTVHKTQRVAYAILAVVSFPLLGIGLGLALFSDTLRYRGKLIDAYCHWNAKDYPGMQKSVQQAQKMCPETAYPLFSLARAQYWEGNICEALEYCNQALAVSPNDVETLTLRANIFIEQEKYEEAMKDVTLALQVKPQSDSLIVIRGEIFSLQGRREEALADFTQALKLNPENVAALCKRAKLYVDLKNWANAVEDLSCYLTKFPKDAGALKDRAHCYAMQGQDELALLDWDRYIELKPDSSVAYLKRGRLHSRLQQLPEALADFNQGIAINPNSKHLCLERGYIYHKMGKFKEALKDFSEALKKDPEWHSPLIARAETHLELGTLSKASDDIKRALQLAPEDPKALKVQGDCLYAAGDFKQAEAYANKSLKAKWTSEAQILKISLGLKKKNPKAKDKALANLSTFLLNNPKYIPALYLSAEVALIDDHNYEAKAYANRILELEPDNLRGLRLRALALFKIKAYPSALADWEKILSLSPPESLRLEAIQTIEKIKTAMKSK